MTVNQVVSLDEWLGRRRKLLVAEKAATRQMDEVARLRRELPWTQTPDYRFESEDGPKSLADLFEGRSQLLVYHFMLGPDWEEGCKSCSFLADHFDGPNRHLQHHDVKLAVVSRAPLDKILAFKRRMGWRFPWVSSHGSEFNFDFGVSFPDGREDAGPKVYNYRETDQVMDEMPGMSVFAKDGAGVVYHTYSTYARGLDLLLGAHNLLDLTPKGRNEKTIMDWVRHHDRYGDAPTPSCCCSAGEAS